MKKKIVSVLIFASSFGAPLGAHEGHEHAEEALDLSLLGLRGLGQLINVHPLFAHFPVVLFLAAALFYFLGILMKKSGLNEAGRWSLWLGTVLAALAVWTGLKAEGTVEHDREVHRIMELHETVGYAVLALGAILSGWLLVVKQAVPAKGRVLFFAALVLLAVLVIQQAYLGGRMVFLHGTGVGRQGGG